MRVWKDDLWLFTPDELERVPVGTEVESVMGSRRILGLDEVDTDTRGGYTAWGVRSPLQHDLKELFMEMILVSA